MYRNIIARLFVCAVVFVVMMTGLADDRPVLPKTMSGVDVKFYEEADDSIGLNLAAWGDWRNGDGVSFWFGEGVKMAIPVENYGRTLTVADVVLVPGSYSGYGTPQIVTDEWMYQKHYAALKAAIGKDPDETSGEWGAYGWVYETDYRNRNYSLSLDIWPERKVVAGRQWILIEAAGPPTLEYKTFYLGLKGSDTYWRYRLFPAFEDEDGDPIEIDRSGWKDVELAVLPMPLDGPYFEVECEVDGVEVAYGEDDSLRYWLVDTRGMSVDSATASLVISAGDVGEKATVYAVAADYMPLGSSGKPEVLPATITSDDGYFYYEARRSLRNGSYDFTLTAIPGVIYELSVGGRKGLSISPYGDSEDTLSILDSSSSRDSAHVLFISPQGGEVSISVDADTSGQISVEWGGTMACDDCYEVAP